MKHSHLVLLLSILVLPAALNADDGAASDLRPIAWGAAEFASGHISMGRVKVAHPV